jgi:hypothetical protein
MKRSKIKGQSQVGYKRPPVESRFKKGQSGNPQGRRRRTPSTIAAMFADELQSTAVISENGRRRKVPKIRLLINEAVKQARDGNFHPLVLITKISHSLEQLSGTATRKNPATDPSGENEFSNLSDEEFDKLVQEKVAPFGLVPAKTKVDKGGDD